MSVCLLPPPLQFLQVYYSITVKNHILSNFFLISVIFFLILNIVYIWFLQNLNIAFREEFSYNGDEKSITTEDRKIKFYKE